VIGWKGRYNYRVLIFYFLFSSFLCCMDGEIKSHQAIVWEVILQNENTIERMGHCATCSLALVSKYFKKMVEKTIDNRKKFFLNYLDQTWDVNSIRWHKHGSACMCFNIIYKHYFPAITDLEIKCAYLYGYGLSTMSYTSTKWNVINCMIAPGTRPFFNSKGDPCLYAYSSTMVENKPHQWPRKRINQYTCGEEKERRCVIDFKDQGHIKRRGLVEVSRLPRLVVAILNSSYTREPVAAWYRKTDPIKILYLSGVTIPDQCINDPIFKRLPQVLQDVLVERHQNRHHATSCLDSK